VPAKQVKNEDRPTDRNRKMMLIAASHVLFIVPLLLYIAYFRRRVNRMTYPLLVALAAFTFLYHGTNLLDTVIH
jgi:hypothetical protein